jgi:hypothetical protein
LEAELKIPVNVINATGGSGVTGHTRGALAKPDGYTLMMITVELNMLHWRGLTNISYQDFEPLVLLNRDDAALFVRADSPVKSLAELQDAIRARPLGHGTRRNLARRRRRMAASRWNEAGRLCLGVDQRRRAVAARIALRRRRFRLLQPARGEHPGAGGPLPGRDGA